MIEEQALDALLREIAANSGLIPRSDWLTQATQFLTSFAAQKSTTIPALLAARALWPALFPDLLPGLLARLTVGETHFFRHPGHFDHLIDALARRLNADASPHIAILSAGCATGEEPYSIAIAIEQRLGARFLANTRILGADLSVSAIEKAKGARYSAWAFRDAPSWLLSHYFKREQGPQWQLCESIRRAVTFEVTHIVDLARRLPAASFDAVFFRNVAIYLVREVIEAAYRDFHRILAPGGLLFVAPADPRPSADLFLDAGHDTTSVYGRRPIAAPVELPIPPAPPSYGRRRLHRHRARLRAPTRPLTHSRGIAPNRKKDKPVDIEVEAMRLADRGDLAGALTLADAFIREHRTDPSGYLLRAQLALGAGNATTAVGDLERSLCLRPEHCLTRYWYVLALRDAGRLEQAMDQIRCLEEALSPEGHALLEDGITTARELLDALSFIKEGLS